MKFLACLFVFVFIAVVLFAVLSLFRFAYVHIKACLIRRKLAKLSATEKKDD